MRDLPCDLKDEGSFCKIPCRSGTVCKDVAYEEISSGARKVHPFFHSEQPNAVLPLMICLFRRAGRGPPLWGQEAWPELWQLEERSTF